jgi:hypothetical protein
LYFEKEEDSLAKESNGAVIDHLLD